MKGRRIYILVFAVYCVLMALLLFGRTRYEPGQMAQSINPMPLETILRFWRVLAGDFSPDMKRYALINLVGNVVIFIPLGFLTAVLWKPFRPLWRCLLLGGGIIVCIELTQLLARVGSCDLDDLLLNVMGIAVGYCLFRMAKGKQK